MSVLDDLKTEVETTISQTWQARRGYVVPTVDDVALQAGGVNLEATFLYSDLVDSTALASWNRLVAAKIYKTFLACSSRIIRDLGGHIRSFDGDRVMAVFIGEDKESNAAECALKISYAFRQILKPAAEGRYRKLRDGTYRLAHCTGVDTGRALVARSGIRGSNDLIWVGNAPNIAAKLSTIRVAGYFSFISEDVYFALDENTTYGDSDEIPMWEPLSWDSMTIYGSNWIWKP